MSLLNLFIITVNNLADIGENYQDQFFAGQPKKRESGKNQPAV